MTIGHSSRKKVYCRVHNLPGSAPFRQIRLAGHCLTDCVNRKRPTRDCKAMHSAWMRVSSSRYLPKSKLVYRVSILVLFRPSFVFNGHWSQFDLHSPFHLHLIAIYPNVCRPFPTDNTSGAYFGSTFVSRCTPGLVFCPQGR